MWGWRENEQTSFTRLDPPPPPSIAFAHTLLGCDFFCTTQLEMALRNLSMKCVLRIWAQKPCHDECESLFGTWKSATRAVAWRVKITAITWPPLRFWPNIGQSLFVWWTLLYGISRENNRKSHTGSFANSYILHLPCLNAFACNANYDLQMAIGIENVWKLKNT